MQRFVGYRRAGGKYSSMARSAVYRQSIGSIPNSGADQPLFPSLSLPFRNAAQPDALKDITIGAFPHYLQHPWPPVASVCLLVSVFLFVLYSTFPSESASYYEIKQAATTYQAAKRCLLGPNAPFAGWVISGEEWESFDARGDLRQPEQDIDMCRQSAAPV